MNHLRTLIEPSMWICVFWSLATRFAYIWGNGTKDFTLTEFWFVDPKTRTKRALSLLFTVCKNQLNPKLTESRTFYFLLKLSYITWYYIKKERSFGFRLWYLELLSNRSGLFVFQPWKFYFVFCYNWKKKFWIQILATTRLPRQSSITVKNAIDTSVHPEVAEVPRSCSTSTGRLFFFKSIWK